MYCMSPGMDAHCYADSLLSVIESGHRPASMVGSMGIFTCQVTEVRIRRLVNRPIDSTGSSQKPVIRGCTRDDFAARSRTDS